MKKPETNKLSGKSWREKRRPGRACEDIYLQVMLAAGVISNTVVSIMYRFSWRFTMLC